MTVNEILSRRVANVLPSKEGLVELMSKKKIRLYQGFDPTGSHLHLGHSIGIRKLMDFASAGHEVIILFGTGTVLAGDPSQRDQARERIAAEQIKHNISTWKDQVKPIVDFNKVNMMYNGEWLLKLTLGDIIEIASNISAVQLFKRDMFQKRLDRGDTVWMHEVLYPILQGYDSVAMDVDLEVGGTDQEFNMLIGRELQKKMNNREKYVLTVPMILGTDGKQMSKTSGNCVWLDDNPDDMFGKLMSIPDSQIVPYLELVTNVPMERVGEIREGFEKETLHPMDAKKELAMTVIEEFHGKEEAGEAKERWESTFQKGETPTDIPSYKVKEGEIIIDILFNSKVVSSRSEAKRLIEQGGVELDGKRISDLDAIPNSGTLRVGKHRFLRITN